MSFIIGLTNNSTEMRHLPEGLSQGCDVPSINYAICATLGDSNPTADSVKIQFA